MLAEGSIIANQQKVGKIDEKNHRNRPKKSWQNCI
jgi:hypothetical protein